MRNFFGVLSILLLSTTVTVSAAESYFPKTPVGEIELKEIPAAKLIATDSDQHYFSDNNGLFGPLFRYISANDIAMTTPVEAEMTPGRMYFYIGGEAADRDLQPTEEVDVLELPARRVASIGSRGSYSKRNFDEAESELRAWLEQNEQFHAVGEARGIFWNGPFTPGFLKRFEVHVSVVKRDGEKTSE